MNKHEWRAIIRDLAWLTQVGFSVAVPPILFLLGAWWLQRRFGLGVWVWAAAIVLGLGTAASSLRSYYRYIQRRAGGPRGQKPHDGPEGKDEP